MMVQLQNADRLTEIITFGTVNQAIDDDGIADIDENGMPVENFQQIGTPVLCGRWSLSTSQLIEQSGLSKSDAFLVVVHHRESWDGITHAKYRNKIYEVTHIDSDSFRNPTAFDRLTLSKVGERNG